MPGPLVEIGAAVVFECAVVTRGAAGLVGSTGDGEGDGFSTGARIGVVCGGRTIGPAGTPIVERVCELRSVRLRRPK